MLKLPPGWSTMLPCYAVLAALRQVKRSRFRIEVIRHLIWAAFDLGFITRWSREKLQIREFPRLIWRIGDHHYIFLPTINDGALSRCTEWGYSPTATIVLVPHNKRALFIHAVEDVLGDRSPTIQSVRDWFSLRMCFSSMDAGWTRQEALEQIVRAYNLRNTYEGLGDRFKIEMPET